MEPNEADPNNDLAASFLKPESGHTGTMGYGANCVKSAFLNAIRHDDEVRAKYHDDWARRRIAENELRKARWDGNKALAASIRANLTALEKIAQERHIKAEKHASADDRLTLHEVVRVLSLLSPAKPKITQEASLALVKEIFGDCSDATMKLKVSGRSFDDICKSATELAPTKLHLLAQKFQCLLVDPIEPNHVRRARRKAERARKKARTEAVPPSMPDRDVEVEDALQPSFSASPSSSVAMETAEGEAVGDSAGGGK